VSEPLHENLDLLYTAFGQESIDAILPGDSFEIDGVEFVCKYSPGSTAERFYLVKSLALVERYRQLCTWFPDASIVELGIAEGGSTALLALWARPRRLIALDLEPTPLGALAEFVAAHGFGGVVLPHYGVDQADRRRVSDIVDADLDGHPIDIVIDDCSHQYDPTRSSFETLFPRLRPGGRYVIEDWNADHVMYDAVRAALTDPGAPHHEAVVHEFTKAMQDPANLAQPMARVPLTRLAAELLVARCSLTEAIASVTVDEFWIVVERGAGRLDADSFRLSDHYTDHFGFVPPRGTPPPDEPA
jgi:predicted O-methyltransferase YrrM